MPLSQKSGQAINNHVSNLRKKLELRPDDPDYIKSVIHNPEKIDGRKHVTIEIYFTYVGKIQIPLQKPELPASTGKPPVFAIMYISNIGGVFMIEQQQRFLRQTKELVDFSFIYDELLDKYCLNTGRNTVPPI